MARKKKGLPFVVQPRLEPVIERVGTEESGIIEISRLGYLTVAEKAIAQNATQGDDSVRNMYSLAGRISRATEVSQAQVMQDLVKQPQPEYLAEFEEEITTCMMDMMAYQERVAIVQATSLIICRVDDSWTVDQSMELHPDLVRALATLYNEEDARQIDALEAAAEAKDKGTEGK